jgi:hypothetical protein
VLGGSPRDGERVDAAERGGACPDVLAGAIGLDLQRQGCPPVTGLGGRLEVAQVARPAGEPLRGAARLGCRRVMARVRNIRAGRPPART